MSNVNTNDFSGAYFSKKDLIQELDMFSLDVMNVGADNSYIDGVNAVINRLIRRKPDLTASEEEDR